MNLPIHLFDERKLFLLKLTQAGHMNVSDTRLEEYRLSNRYLPGKGLLKSGSSKFSLKKVFVFLAFQGSNFFN